MTAPFAPAHQVPVQPVATAGNDLNTNVLIVPRDGTITQVTYTPQSTITGAATNNRTISLVNLGQNGSGNTVVATLNFGNGTNATGGVTKVIPLSGTPANLAVSAGDVLQWQSTHVGTGIADPGGLAVVNFGAKYS